jgi:sec-independent protein translocase protein TatC
MSQEQSRLSMGFFDHLDELRVRLIRCLIVFMLGFMLCYFLLNQWVVEFLKAPLFQILPPGEEKLYYTHLFENFLTHLKVAGFSALFLFSPYYFYQIWAFIAPGLYPHERKLVVPFSALASLFFIGGAAFAYFVLFPVGFHFFVTFGADSDIPILTVGNYYGTVIKLLLVFGLAFEIPVFVFLLGYLGVVDAPFLRENRRYAIIGISVVSAFSAPPDAISMLILMAPLILFYEATVLLVDWLGRNRAEKQKQKEEETKMEKEDEMEKESETLP